MSKLFALIQEPNLLRYFTKKTKDGVEKITHFEDNEKIGHLSYNLYSGKVKLNVKGTKIAFELYEVDELYKLLQVFLEEPGANVIEAYKMMYAKDMTDD